MQIQIKNLSFRKSVGSRLLFIVFSVLMCSLLSSCSSEKESSKESFSDLSNDTSKEVAEDPSRDILILYAGKGGVSPWVTTYQLSSPTQEQVFYIDYEELSFNLFEKKSETESEKLQKIERSLHDLYFGDDDESNDYLYDSIMTILFDESFEKDEEAFRKHIDRSLLYEELYLEI